MKRLLPSLAGVYFLCGAVPLLAQITMSCPGDTTINLAPGQCSIPYFYSISAMSPCGSPTTISQTGGPPLASGDNFPIGMTTLTFSASNACGENASCSFTVTVNGYTPSSPGLVCNQGLNVSLPPTCELYLDASMVLTGNYGCYSNFTVNVNNSGSNYIGYNLVGRTVPYMVTNTQTGVSCWGNLLIEDKVGPLITECNDTTINCLQDSRPVSVGGDVADPLFSDCTTFSVVYIDMVTQGTCNDPFSMQIMRIWTATDARGYSSTCTQMITVERISLSDINPICPRDTTVECVPGVTPNFSPAALGYPTADVDGTIYQITDGANSLCNITASYSDQIIQRCGASYRIIRTWTIIDWCEPVVIGTNPWTCTQYILYNDTTAPGITPPANMSVNANLPGCRARPVIPPATITDCSSVTVLMTTPTGPIVGNGGQVPPPGLTVGTHSITIKATDACGNSSTATFSVTVADTQKPTAVCDANTVVALDVNGYGFAYAESFDNGSTDNCCIDYFQVRRLSDNCGDPASLNFGDYAEFCCADVGTALQVTMRVYDCHGNFNDCTVNVQVQDFQMPSITCPPDISVTCGTDYTDLDITGTVVTDPADQTSIDGLATDNCATNLIITYEDDGEVTCGAAQIVRTFTASGPGGQSASCDQTINVVNDNPMTGASIVFPADITVSGCSSADLDTSATGNVILPPPSLCYNLTYTFTDEILPAGQSGCRKIFRHWVVYDWCQYDPNEPGSPGRWAHTQTIMVIDSGAPVPSNCTNRTFCNFKPDCSGIAPDLSISATDACTPANLLTYSWVVDLYNDGTTDIGSAYSGNGQNTTNSYPIGTHKITYSIGDGCGNTGTCSFLFTIEDCKKPTVACQAINVEMMQGGSVDVNVRLAESGSSDNCTSRANLKFSYSPFVDDTIRTFTCSELGANVVEVWATDEDNNQDFCVTQITIQDNMGACASPLIALGGSIANEQHQGVQNVSVELGGYMSGTTLTNQQGNYQFPNVPINNQYTITPRLNDNLLNGVTTYDIVLLQRHILSLQLLDSPYKIIAGDVNNNGVLSVSDVVDLRKIVLYVLTEFPNNTSWRFVDGTHSFQNSQNPFDPPFPEVCNINNFNGSHRPDFMAVKVGDLNGTALGSNLYAGNSDRGVVPDFIIRALDREVKATELVTVDFSADLAELLAYQFTLNFDQTVLEFQELLPGADSDLANFGLTLLDEGAITASWSQLAAPIGSQEQRLFSLVFKAKKGGKLSELLIANSRYTKSEGYGENGDLRNIVLQFTQLHGSPVEASRFELFQNIPNPFTGHTTIGFNLPEASVATLTVFDVAGRMVFETKAEFTGGYHEINIEKSALPNKGIFYYRLETPGHTATKKMTLL